MFNWFKELMRPADWSQCDNPRNRCWNYQDHNQCTLYGNGHKPKGSGCPEYYPVFRRKDAI